MMTNSRGSTMFPVGVLLTRRPLFCRVPHKKRTLIDRTGHLEQQIVLRATVLDASLGAILPDGPEVSDGGNCAVPVQVARGDGRNLGLGFRV